MALAHWLLRFRILMCRGYRAFPHRDDRYTFVCYRFTLSILLLSHACSRQGSAEWHFGETLQSLAPIATQTYVTEIRPGVCHSGQFFFRPNVCDVAVAFVFFGRGRLGSWGPGPEGVGSRKGGPLTRGGGWVPPWRGRESALQKGVGWVLPKGVGVL